MAWSLTGQWLEMCSCKLLCPCNLGSPAEPDRGWCSAAIVLDIERGNSDGIDLGGVPLALALDFPGDFWLGNGTARIYINDTASADQRRELEAIFGGQKGGVWAAIGGILTKVLPTQSVPITIQRGDNPSATVGDVGQVPLQRVKTQAGQQTRLENGAAPMAFGIERPTDIARSNGGRWSDPELRQWESGGNGVVATFDWSA